MYTCIKSIIHKISQSMNMFNHKVYNIVIILECTGNFQKINLSSYFPCGSYFGSFFLDSFIIEQFSTCNTWYFDADSNVCYNGHTKYLRWLGLLYCVFVMLFRFFYISAMIEMRWSKRKNSLPWPKSLRWRPKEIIYREWKL